MDLDTGGMLVAAASVGGILHKVFGSVGDRTKATQDAYDHVLGLYKGELDRATAARTQLEGQVADLASQVQALKSKLDDHQEEIEALRVERDEADREQERLQRELIAMTAERNKYRDQYEDLLAQISTPDFSQGNQPRPVDRTAVDLDLKIKAVDRKDPSP